MLSYRNASLASLAALAVFAAACSRTVDGSNPPEAAAPPRAPAALAGTPAEALDLLRKAERFEDTHVGYSGSLSVYVAAFRVVLAEPDASKLFHGLVDDATMAGRLYGAAGIYFADPPEFEAALAKINAIGGTVATQHGCMGETEKVANVIRESGGRRIEIQKGVTMKSWFAANRDGGMCDLAGGCTPLSFVADDRPAPRDPAR